MSCSPENANRAASPRIGHRCELAARTSERDAFFQCRRQLIGHNILFPWDSSPAGPLIAALSHREPDQFRTVFMGGRRNSNRQKRLKTSRDVLQPESPLPRQTFRLAYGLSAAFEIGPLIADRSEAEEPGAAPLLGAHPWSARRGVPVRSLIAELLRIPQPL